VETSFSILLLGRVLFSIQHWLKLLLDIIINSLHFVTFFFLMEGLVFYIDNSSHPLFVLNISLFLNGFSFTLIKKSQVMINLGYHGKGPKTLLTSIALSSMIRKRYYEIVSVLSGIIFYLTDWFTDIFPLK